MCKPEDEARKALQNIVEWSRKRELPPGEGVKPLQDVLKDSNLISILAKQFPFPLGVFNRDGIFEMANDEFLEKTEIIDKDIKAGRASINGIKSQDFHHAVKLALQGEISVVNDLDRPFEYIGVGYAYGEPNTVCAILFPIIEEKETIFKGAVVFLPSDLLTCGETSGESKEEVMRSDRQ